MALDEIMGELAQYMRMQEEISQTVEALKDQLKQHMAAAGEWETAATLSELLQLIRQEVKTA